MNKEMGDLTVKIRESYHKYTKAEIKVADYILTRTKEVLFMSITDLADACGVGDTTVFRFCKQLGLQGYQEFKMRLSLGLNQEDRSAELLDVIEPEDGVETVASRVLQHTVDILTETHALIDTVTFKQAVNCMTEADHIHFFGVGASGTIGMVAFNKFMKITNNVQYVIDSHMQCMKAAMLTKRDVAIIISYSGATKDMIDVAEIAKKAGAKVIVITKFLKTALTKYADVVIRCGSKEGPLEGGSSSSQMSQIFIIELLYLEFYRKKSEVTQGNVHKTSSAVLNKLY